ncbi:MAG: rod shape-determining protein MreD [Dongiaceae bacterium]
MKPGFWQRLDLWARRLGPFLSALLLLLLGTIPLRLPYLGSITPDFAIMAVFFWAVHRPGSMPAPAVFLLGVISDVLGGTPFGVGVLVLLAAYWVTRSQRRLLIGQPFLVVWWGFMMVSAGALILTWLVVCLLAVQFVNPTPALFAYFLGLALYPIVTQLFTGAQRLVDGRT